MAPVEGSRLEPPFPWDGHPVKVECSQAPCYMKDIQVRRHSKAFERLENEPGFDKPTLKSWAKVAGLLILIKVQPTIAALRIPPAPDVHGNTESSSDLEIHHKGVVQISEPYAIVAGEGAPIG